MQSNHNKTVPALLHAGLFYLPGIFLFRFEYHYSAQNIIIPDRNNNDTHNGLFPLIPTQSGADPTRNSSVSHHPPYSPDFCPLRTRKASRRTEPKRIESILRHFLDDSARLHIKTGIYSISNLQRKIGAFLFETGLYNAACYNSIAP